MVVISISGVPGAGKTTLANKLAKVLNAQVINILDFTKSQKIPMEYDEAFQTYLIDEKIFIEKITEYIKNSNKNIIIEGVFAHILPKNIVDLFVLVEADPNDLYKRLLQRNYPYHKIFENIWAQNMRIIEDELLEEGKKYLIVNTSKESLDEIINKISRCINNK